MKIIYWRLMPLMLFILLVVLLMRGLSLNPQLLGSTQLGKPLPIFRLSSLDNPNSWFTPAAVNGKISLLNVWASWCPACIDEQVFLLQLARVGVPIYGLNYKDKRDEALKWLSEWGNPYKIIGEDQDGKVAIDLGVYGAPETFLIDKAGIIRYRHAGALTPIIWQTEFFPRIKQMELKA